MTAVYDHCSSTKDICKLSKGVSGFSRVDLAPIPKRREGLQFGLVIWVAVHRSLAFTPQAINFPSHFLESQAFPGGTPFTPNKRTPFLYSTLQDVLGPAGTLQRCLITHRNYLDHTTFQETTESGSFKYHVVESKEHLPSIGSSFFYCLHPSYFVACDPLIQLRGTFLPGPAGQGN